MKNNNKITEIIKNKIITDYKDDVALLVQYSIDDKLSKENKILDLFYVPKTEKSIKLSTQFIIDGVSYDLFPMRWDRLISIASLDSPQTYLLTESKVLYYNSDEDLYRFNKLKNDVQMVLGPKYNEAMLNKAFEYFNETYIYLHNMSLVENRMIDIRIEASKILSKISNALAFANQRFYKGGQGTNVSIIEESFKLEKLPNDYKSFVGNIMSAKDIETIKNNSLSLVNNTRDFLQKEREQYVQPEPFETFFVGYYEELKSILNRFETACINKNQSKLYLLATYIHEEISQFLTKSKYGIWYNDRNIYSEYSSVFDEYFGVDLLEQIANEDYDNLLDTINTFEKKFIDLLSDNDIKLLDFPNIMSFKEYFENNK